MPRRGFEFATRHMRRGRRCRGCGRRIEEGKMFSKRALIVLLIGINVLLFVALVVGSYSLPTAYAQVSPSGSRLVCVTAKAAGRSYDVLYTVDFPTHRMYAFYPSGGRTERLLATPPRDLPKDFGR